MPAAHSPHARPPGGSLQPLAYSSAARDSNSNPTNRSSPTTHASWPGSMTYTSPGPTSASVPSSCLMASRPAWTTPTWRAWQLSVPATGLTHSDQRHPGSNVIRAAVVPAIRTTSTCVLSGVLVSSGESKSRDSTPGTAVSSRRSPKDPRAASHDRGSELALDLELARVDRDAAARCL